MTDGMNPVKAAMQVLDPLIASRRLLSVIEGANAAGVLRAIAHGATVEAVVKKTGMNGRVLATVLDALHAGGVADRDGGVYSLTPAWRAVCGSEAVRPLEATLAGERVGDDLMRHVGSGDDYWTMPPADQVTFAASVSPDPMMWSLIPMFRARAEAGHPIQSVIAEASRYLELGCGLAGFSLSLLQLYPDLTVTGVERSEHLADEAERRASVLGVSDRFHVVRGDATVFHDPEPFAVAFWSQFFFPEQDRSGALAVLMRQVAPGGLVFAPTAYADAEAGASEAAVLRYRTFRVMAQSWGVPERRPDQLAEEFESAGFTDVRVLAQPGVPPQVIATRP